MKMYKFEANKKIKMRRIFSRSVYFRTEGSPHNIVNRT